MPSTTSIARPMGLTALFFFLLSIINFAAAAPLPAPGKELNALIARADLYEGPTITEDEYRRYLLANYPDTGKYILYSGDSADQVRAFQGQNPGYHYAKDFFDVPPSQHYQGAFSRVDANGNTVWRNEDAEAYSRAIAKEATGEVHVFGAIEYKDFPSYYSTEEADNIKQGLRDGRLTAIKHMKMDALSVNDVLATEDADGNFDFKDGASSSTKNSSKCRRDGTSCGLSSSDSKPSTDSDSSKRPYGNPAEQVTHTGESTTDHTSSSGAGEAAHRGAPAQSESGRLRGPIRIPK